MDDTFYTVDEIAKKLKVTRQTIIKEIERKELVAVKVGKQYRISDKHLSEYLTK